MAESSLAAALQAQAQRAAQQPKIFIDVSGKAIPIFLSVEFIKDRTKLVRLLTSRGARVCKRTTDAQIVLVNGETNNGRRFVRDNAADRTVLDYTWIDKSVAQGRVLMEQDGWGGCLLVDDGEPIPEGDDDMDVYDEVEGGGDDPDEEPVNASGSTKPPSRARPSSTAGPSSPTRSGPLSSPPPARGSSHLSNSHLSSPTPTADSHIPTPTQTSQMQNQFNFPGQFPPNQFMGPPMNGFPANIPPVQGMPQFPPGQFPQMMNGMLPPNFAQFIPHQPPLQHPSSSIPVPAIYSTYPRTTATLHMLLETAIAVAQHDGFDPTPFHIALLSIPRLEAYPEYPTVTQLPVPQLPQAAQNSTPPSSPVPQAHARPPATPASQRTPARPPMSSTKPKSHTLEDGTPVIVKKTIPKRPRPSDPGPQQSHSQARSSTSKGKQPASGSTSASAPVGKKRGRPSKVKTSTGASPSTSRVAQTSESASTSAPVNARAPENLFTTAKGHQLRFMIQVEVKKRPEYLQKIRNYGAKIIAGIEKAHYAVLNPNTTPYRDYCDIARRNKVPVVHPAFINECISQGRLVDPKDFPLDPPTQKKPGRQSGNFISFQRGGRRRADDDGEEQEEQEEQEEEDAGEDAEMDDGEGMEVDEDEEDEEEQEEEVQEVQAGLDNSTAPEQSIANAPQADEGENPAKKPPLSPAAQKDLNEDFEIIVEFLLSDQSDGATDAQVFAMLEEKATCKTQPSWLVFLEEYGSEVEQAVTRRAEEWNANAQIKASPPL